MTFPERRENLNATYRLGIEHLKRQGFTRKMVAAHLEVSVNMIDQITKRPDVLLRADRDEAFRVLCSDHGFELLSDRACGTGKRCLPAPEAAEGDGCILKEVRDVAESVGLSSVHFTRNDYTGMRLWAMRGIAAFLGIIADAHVLEALHLKRRAL